MNLTTDSMHSMSTVYDFLQHINCHTINSFYFIKFYY